MPDRGFQSQKGGDTAPIQTFDAEAGGIREISCGQQRESKGKVHILSP